jgi:alpha-glucosidase
LFSVTRRAFSVSLLLAPLRLKAEDERRVISPNGEFEFRIFVGQPKDGLWPRVGYQVVWRGKPLITTSWMGLDIRDQEPFLGENPGFISAEAASNALGHYNSLTVHYMQDGSLGRRLDVEIRAYDDAVAFRYLIPRSTPLEEILIRNEATEFNFAQPEALRHLATNVEFDLPFAIEEPGIGWVVIVAAGDALPGKYPHTYLDRSQSGLVTNLARSRKDPTVAFTGATPLAWPWRVIMAGADKERLLDSGTLSNLNR